MTDRRAGALRTTVTDPAGAGREAVVLRVADEDGVVGWGEASPLPGYSPDELDAVEAGLDRWAARWERGLVGGTDGDGDILAMAKPEDDAWTAEALVGLPAARCAIDTALLDLAARRLGVPLHALLLDLDRPARPVERVPVAALVTLAGVSRPGAPAGPELVMRAVADRVAAGYRTVKLKMGGEDYRFELEQILGIRAQFPYLHIRLDVNGAWTPDQARTRIGDLKRQVNPELVEQPVGPEALLSLGSVGVPLAADESLRLPGAIDRLAEPGGCAFVVLKPMVLGGLRACQRIADAAFGHGIGAIVSHTFGGPVAHAAACELALALAAVDPAGGAAAAGLAGHDDLPQRSGPWIVPAQAAGHGVERPW